MLGIWKLVLILQVSDPVYWCLPENAHLASGKSEVYLRNQAITGNCLVSPVPMSRGEICYYRIEQFKMVCWSSWTRYKIQNSPQTVILPFLLSNIPYMLTCNVQCRNVCLSYLHIYDATAAAIAQ